MVATGSPDRVPETEAVLDGAIQLPAELADVGDPQRETGHGAHGQLAGTHVGECQLLRRQRLEDRPGARSPEPEARVPRGDVLDLHSIGCVHADPGEVVPSESRPRHDAEALLREPRDGEIALDPTTLVEHLRVRDRPDVARDPVVTEPLEEVGCLLARDLDLRERRLVEERSCGATSDVLCSDRR